MCIRDRNCNGAAYAAVQGSYPVLAWEAERSPATHAVRITQPEGGTIAADAGETVAFGTVLHLSNTPDIGWAFRTYTLNGETLTGPYATVTADAAVSGVFSGYGHAGGRRRAGGSELCL